MTRKDTKEFSSFEFTVDHKENMSKFEDKYMRYDKVDRYFWVFFRLLLTMFIVEPLVLERLHGFWFIIAFLTYSAILMLVSGGISVLIYKYIEHKYKEETINAYLVEDNGYYLNFRSPKLVIASIPFWRIKSIEAIKNGEDSPEYFKIVIYRYIKYLGKKVRVFHNVLGCNIDGTEIVLPMVDNNGKYLYDEILLKHQLRK